MLTLLTAATLLATTPAEAPAPRFADTHATEAHREVLQGLSRGRGQVLGLYNWASSRVTLDHDLTEPQARQVGEAVRATAAAWTRMADKLPAAQAGLVQTEVTFLRDLFTKADGLAARLAEEAATPAPRRTEVRHLSSGLYGSLAMAEDLQHTLARKLGIASEAPSPGRAR
ncbi:MAG: hypothetical protein IPF77_07175 [Gemmatimonadetes bacterium]|nr:hypothetical protein [Gemmatimonadota bacterium]MBK9691643.1 hypothetical protein [Gemmatimonadota bacterium]